MSLVWVWVLHEICWWFKKLDIKKYQFYCLILQNICCTMVTKTKPPLICTHWSHVMTVMFVADTEKFLFFFLDHVSTCILTTVLMCTHFHTWKAPHLVQFPRHHSHIVLLPFVVKVQGINGQNLPLPPSPPVPTNTAFISMTHYIHREPVVSGELSPAASRAAAKSGNYRGKFKRLRK